MDTLANALITIKNNSLKGNEDCEVRPASKVIGSILKILQKEGYIGGFEFIDDGKAGVYKIQLLGKINNCRAIKPRYSVKVDEITKWEKQYLPAKSFGRIIISTPAGVFTQNEARARNQGGKLMAFVY